MNALAKHLATGLDVRCGSMVFAIYRVAQGWEVQLDDGTRHRADALVLTCPLPQAFALLVTAGVELPESLVRTEYDRTLCLLAVLDRPSAVPAPGGVQGVAGVTFVGDNQAKGLSAVPALTVHADPAWSEALVGRRPRRDGGGTARPRRAVHRRRRGCRAPGEAVALRHAAHHLARPVLARRHAGAAGARRRRVRRPARRRCDPQRPRRRRRLAALTARRPFRSRPLAASSRPPMRVPHVDPSATGRCESHAQENLRASDSHPHQRLGRSSRYESHTSTRVAHAGEPAPATRASTRDSDGRVVPPRIGAVGRRSGKLVR